MKSTKKVQLSILTVSSFVTTIEKSDEKTVKGGAYAKKSTANSCTCPQSMDNTCTGVFSYYTC